MKSNLKLENLVSPNQVVDLLGDALVIVDAKENIVFANRATTRFFGLPKTKLIGKNIERFHSTAAKKIVAREIKTKRRKGKASTYQIDVKTARGKIIPTLVTGSPLIRKGRFVGSIGVFTDISKREKIRQELQRSKEFLEKIVNCMGEGLIADHRIIV